MYGMIVMLRYHQTNSGALNTMVALKWNGKGEIDILVTILVCWRLGPYADPDQQGDMYDIDVGCSLKGSTPSTIA